VSEDLDELFQRVFETELAYVWNALRRLGIRAPDREDLAQEVFVRVHKAMATYDATRPVRPWLFAFAFRVASDFRRLKRHRVEVAGTEAAVNVPSTSMPDEEAEASRRRALLFRALETLDLDKRAVVILHEIEEVPIPEVAQALGIPVGTASSRLRAGRQLLAEALGAFSRAGERSDG
jgi:RNA polymerase sigma-70 factor, ECF subfamily